MKRLDEARAVRAQAGTSVVEMAIVLPLLILIVFAIGDFGVAYARWNSLTNAVREGAREGVIFRASCVEADVRTDIENTVSNFAASSGIDGPSIITTVTGECDGTGSPLTVHSTVPHNYIAMSALAGFAPTVDLVAQTVMRNE